MTVYVPPNPPLKYHGGKGAFKGKLAKWIISLMPPHLHYVEPYFGGGSVLLYKDPEGISEVVNDLNWSLMDFWTVLKEDHYFKEFCRLVEATPFAEDEFRVSRLQASSLPRQAARFFVRCRQSRQGLQKDFATLSRNRTRGGMNEQVSAWLTAIDGLPDVHARLKRVVILNRPAVDVIREQDGPNTCFYLDPPYLHETRTTTSDYAHEMNPDQHEELLRSLAGIRGKFLLSGYRSDLYETFAGRHGWFRHEFSTPNNASSKSTKERKVECVWRNF